MDENWKQSMEQFSRVWPRVQGKAPPPPPDGRRPPPPPPTQDAGHRPPPPTQDAGHRPPPPPPPRPGARDAEILERLMRMEARAERRYLAMAEAVTGKTAETLRALAAGRSRALRRLQREYYLRTGDSYPLPPTRPVKPEPPREGLRRAWGDAGALEQAYSDAAFATADEGLREFFGDGAMRARADRRTLHALAGRLF